MADAAECPPTFGADPNTIVTVMAGGLNAVRYPNGLTEDNEELGKADILAENITEKDVVMGISAGGNAGYVVGAMKAAKERGCTLLSLSCNKPCKIGDLADIEITTHTGAEVITGSTRMKAGNAQKMVLNMISTEAMIQTGKVYQNLMINLSPLNDKIRKRMVEVVKEIYKTDEIHAKELLEQYSFDICAIIDALPPWEE